jgi:hypothetical protein
MARAYHWTAALTLIALQSCAEQSEQSTAHAGQAGDASVPGCGGGTAEDASVGGAAGICPLDVSCRQCCIDTYNAGLQWYAIYASSCVCQPSVCGNECGVSCKTGAKTEATCIDCYLGAILKGGECYSDSEAIPRCLTNCACRQFLDCYRPCPF